MDIQSEKAIAKEVDKISAMYTLTTVHIIPNPESMVIRFIMEDMQNKIQYLKIAVTLALAILPL